MKKLLFCFYLFSNILSLNAQYYNDYFLRVSKAYKSNTEITELSMMDGDYAFALQKLSKLDKSSFDYISNLALLKYNTLGKDSAINFIESTSLNKEDQLFIQWWIADLTKNIEDEEILKENFISKYKESIPMIKHKYLNIISDYYHLKDESPTMLENIAKIEQKGNLDTSDIIFFELMKCQIYDKDEWRKCELIDILSSLWKKYPQYLDKSELLNVIEECKSTSCDALRKDVITNKINTIQEPKVSDLIIFIDNYLDNRNYNDSLLLFCNELKERISNSDSRLMHEKMLGIVKLMTMTTNYSSIFKGIEVEKLNYPLDFRQFIKSKSERSDLHELLEYDIKELSNIIPEVKNLIIQDFGVNIDNYKDFTTEDISTLLGFKSLLFYLIVHNNFNFIDLEDIKESMLSVDADYYNESNPFEEFENKVTNNPLFVEKTKYSLPEVENFNDLNKYIEILNNVIKIYPGSSSLMLTKLELIDNYFEDFTKEQNKLVFEYFNTAIDLMNIVQIMGIGKGYDYTFEEIFKLKTTNSYTFYTDKYESFRKSLELLTAKEKNYLINKIEKLLQSKPSQKNLNILLKSINNGYYEK
jgi:hypothetical protein